MNYTTKDLHGTIGKRLVEERKRLGLSQTAFGELGGVKKSAQYTYEKDERKPDAEYLAAISRAGVDVAYVLTGESSERKRVAMEAVFGALARTLGIDIEALGKVIEMAENIAWPEDEHRKDPFASTEKVDDLVRKLLAIYDVKGGNYIIGGDGRSDDDNLLCSTVSKFETCLMSRSDTPKLSPRKKAQSIAMLYRIARATGRVEIAMIEAAIDLARQD